MGVSGVLSSLAKSKDPDSESADFDPRVARGKMAYGKKKAAMFGRMAKKARMVFLTISFNWGYLPPRRCFIGRLYSISATESRN